MIRSLNGIIFELNYFADPSDVNIYRPQQILYQSGPINHVDVAVLLGFPMDDVRSTLEAGMSWTTSSCVQHFARITCFSVSTYAGFLSAGVYMFTTALYWHFAGSGLSTTPYSARYDIANTVVTGWGYLMNQAFDQR